MRVCSVGDCGRTAYAKGVCEMHYKRIQRNGTTDRQRGKVWTESQLANLRRIYETFPPPALLPPAADLEALLGHSMRGISAKARQLGLTDGQRQTTPRTIPDKVCPSCGVSFRTDAAQQVCCSRSCGAKHAIATRGHQRGMAGKKHSDATKQRLSEASTSNWQAATPAERSRMLEPMQAVPHRPTGNTFSRTKSGKRADLGGLFLRSAWEANYARYLNFLVRQGAVASWEYEPKTFEFPVKRGNKTYTPDFRVVLPGGEVEWHEVKGWMTNDSRIKLERFARHFPSERLVLIDERSYRALAKDVAPLVDGWES